MLWSTALFSPASAIEGYTHVTCKLSDVPSFITKLDNIKACAYPHSNIGDGEGRPKAITSDTAQVGSTTTWYWGMSDPSKILVMVLDTAGNIVTDSKAPITVSIKSGPDTNGAVLSGTKTANANNGIATFSDLSIDKAGQNYQLVASSNGLTSGTSSAFNVNGLKITSLCPIDISITDPSGLEINKNHNDIPGATFTEIDLDDDGDIDNVIIFPEKKIGDYLITVTPKLGALPSEKFSIEATADGETIELANNVPISSIPSQGYIVRSTKSGITNWDYSFKDSTRGTKIYINTVNETFQFIAPDKEFPIKKATRMKIIDFSKEKEPPIRYDSSNKKWKLDGKKLDIDDDLKPFAEQHQFNQRPDKIILINHKDSDLQLSAVVVDGKEDSCVAIARDLKTKKIYMLIVKPELKRFPKK